MPSESPDSGAGPKDGRNTDESREPGRANDAVSDRADAENRPEQDDTDEKDIVDHLSEATGYFHDDDAARLRDIADSGGQKPVGVVRAGVEKEIERREWRCVHFEHDEEDEYPSRNPYEYYRIHKRLQKEYEAAMDALPTEEKHMREVQVHEHAHETLKEKAREHEAKADMAEQWLCENGEDPEAVLAE